MIDVWWRLNEDGWPPFICLAEIAAAHVHAHAYAHARTRTHTHALTWMRICASGTHTHTNATPIGAIEIMSHVCLHLCVCACVCACMHACFFWGALSGWARLWYSASTADRAASGPCEANSARSTTTPTRSMYLQFSHCCITKMLDVTVL